MKKLPNKIKSEPRDRLCLARFVVLVMAVLCSAGCATKGPLTFSGSTIRHINDRPSVLGGVGTSINLHWHSDEVQAGQRNTVGGHAGEFTFSLLKTSTEAMKEEMDPRAVFLVPVVWAGSLVTGAVYGTVGHIVASPGKVPDFPDRFRPGETFVREVSLRCLEAGSSRPRSVHDSKRKVNLELWLLNEGLSLESGRFDQFRFEIVAHARLTDESGEVTLADLLLREGTAPRKMQYWKRYAGEQWTGLISDMERKLADRLNSELESVLGSSFDRNRQPRNMGHPGRDMEAVGPPHLLVNSDQ